MRVFHPSTGIWICYSDPIFCRYPKCPPRTKSFLRPRLHKGGGYFQRIHLRLRSDEELILKGIFEVSAGARILLYLGCSRSGENLQSCLGGGSCRKVWYSSRVVGLSHRWNLCSKGPFYFGTTGKAIVDSGYRIAWGDGSSGAAARRGSCRDRI